MAWLNVSYIYDPKKLMCNSHPVSWSYRIHQLHLCWKVRLLPTNKVINTRGRDLDGCAIHDLEAKVVMWPATLHLPLTGLDRWFQKPDPINRPVISTPWLSWTYSLNCSSCNYPTLSYLKGARIQSWGSVVLR